MNKKKWLDKFASPEGAVRVVETHTITPEEINIHEQWKAKVARKYSLPRN